jgi:hypothetical protein
MTLVIFSRLDPHASLALMTQATGTKLMGQPMETGKVPRNKKSLIQQVAAIANVFGDDLGLLKLLLTLTDEEIAGIHKFSQAYKDGSFPIDVMVEPAPSYEKSGIFP